MLAKQTGLALEKLLDTRRQDIRGCAGIFVVDQVVDC